MSTTEYNRKWRANNRDKMTANKKRVYQQTQGGRNTGKPWTDEEIKRVLAHEIPDRQLADELGRSVQAIQVIRSKRR